MIHAFKILDPNKISFILSWLVGALPAKEEKDFSRILLALDLNKALMERGNKVRAICNQKTVLRFVLQERTKNAQFIIISLRNNMFELADRLIGIYKTHDCTKSVTVNPNLIATQG